MLECLSPPPERDTLVFFPVVDLTGFDVFSQLNWFIGGMVVVEKCGISGIRVMEKCCIGDIGIKEKGCICGKVVMDKWGISGRED